MFSFIKMSREFGISIDSLLGLNVYLTNSPIVVFAFGWFISSKAR